MPEKVFIMPLHGSFDFRRTLNEQTFITEYSPLLLVRGISSQGIPAALTNLTSLAEGTLSTLSRAEPGTITQGHISSLA